MNKTTLKELIEKYAADALSKEESMELARLLEDDQQRTIIEELLRESYLSGEYASPETTAQKVRFEQLMQERMEQLNETNEPAVVPVHRIHFLKTAWFRYAAAIVVMAALGTFAYLRVNKTNRDQTVVANNSGQQKDIGPGGQKAILRLADGTEIILDKADTGAIAKQGSASVVKLADGQIAYSYKGSPDGEVMVNTMRTPRGGQYQLDLPDGTHVWLNAASSITYPVVFVEKERRVKISGEAYFEVAKNRKQPLIVDIDGKARVQVLGTHFNIHSYHDEEAIQTTLIEGSISLATGNAATAAANREPSSSVVLKPGQQAVVAGAAQQGDHNTIQVRMADTDQVIAWKNGIFHFNGAGLQTVMKQLERWYDIRVKYEGPVPAIVFKGKMYRNVNLSDVLEMLERTGVHFRMEGKTLIITG